MRVVFLENVANNRVGEVKEVKDGYGRNFLLPRKLAAVATVGVLRQLEEERAIAARRAARQEARAGDIAKKIEATQLVVKARVGSQERLYGSVTSSQIADELQKVIGEPVDRRRLGLTEPIRRLGTYRIPLELSHDVTATVTVIIEGPKGERSTAPVINAAPAPAPQAADADDADDDE
ncbi:MAG: 50S ribosomal protein L9 [Chloroflexi bacterium]|nr:50S ribosomal protein L9 [Chloroflexota bacterium]